MPKIVILDGFTVDAGQLQWKDIQMIGDTTIYQRTMPEQVVERCKGAEIVLTNKVVLDADVLNQLPRLLYIGVLATGYNVIDLQAAAKQNVIVTNIPAYSTMSVAQMTFAHILNIVSRVNDYAIENRKGRWKRCLDFSYIMHDFHELAGLTLGIVGLGNTGMAVAKIAIAFGMKVIAFTSKSSRQMPEGVVAVGLDELFAESDIVSLHCPLNDSTYHLVDENRLKNMKKTAILINTGRGPLVNDRHLAKALNKGTIAAYGADVLTQEPPTTDNPLLHAENAFITPHIAWATVEARRRLIKIAADNIRAFINGKPINVVEF